MILDNTYFQGELSLPNLKINSEAVGHAATSMQVIGENNLYWFIDKYERIFLECLLGVKLAKSFTDGLQEDPVNTIWIQLRDSLYTKGLRFSYSPVANYVYYWARRDGRTQTAVHGEKVGTQDYAQIVHDDDKMVKAWNEMCVLVSKFYCEFLRPNWNAYKGYSDGCISCNCFEPINSFGI